MQKVIPVCHVCTQVECNVPGTKGNTHTTTLQPLFAIHALLVCELRFDGNWLIKLSTLCFLGCTTWHRQINLHVDQPRLSKGGDIHISRLTCTTRRANDKGE